MLQTRCIPCQLKWAESRVARQVPIHPRSTLDTPSQLCTKCSFQIIFFIHLFLSLKGDSWCVDHMIRRPLPDSGWCWTFSVWFPREVSVQNKTDHRRSCRCGKWILCAQNTKKNSSMDSVAQFPFLTRMTITKSKGLHRICFHQWPPMLTWCASKLPLSFQVLILALGLGLGLGLRSDSQDSHRFDTTCTSFSSSSKRHSERMHPSKWPQEDCPSNSLSCPKGYGGRRLMFSWVFQFGVFRSLWELNVLEPADSW